MIDNLEKLKILSKREVQVMYRNFFTSAEGQLILEDLKYHFYEYDYPNNDRAIGQQSVLIYIKNLINPPDESYFDKP